MIPEMNRQCFCFPLKWLLTRWKIILKNCRGSCANIDFSLNLWFTITFTCTTTVWSQSLAKNDLKTTRKQVSHSCPGFRFLKSEIISRTRSLGEIVIMGTVIVSEQTKSSSSSSSCPVSGQQPFPLMDCETNTWLPLFSLRCVSAFCLLSTIYVTTLSHVIGVSIKCRTEGWSIVGEVFKERQKSRTEIISPISCASSFADAGRDREWKRKALDGHCLGNNNNKTDQWICNNCVKLIGPINWIVFVSQAIRFLPFSAAAAERSVWRVSHEDRE